VATKDDIDAGGVLLNSTGTLMRGNDARRNPTAHPQRECK
jgi:hypothetical protein